MGKKKKKKKKKRKKERKKKRKKGHDDTHPHFEQGPHLVVETGVDDRDIKDRLPPNRVYELLRAVRDLEEPKVPVKEDSGGDN